MQNRDEIAIPKPIWYKKERKSDSSAYSNSKHSNIFFSFIYPYYINNAPEVLLRTYPRSGCNYFFNIFRQRTGYSMPRTHSSKDNCLKFWYLFEKSKGDQDIFSIIRNPLDTIVSSYVMGISHIYKDDNFNEEEIGIEHGLNMFMKMYCYWYDNLDVENTIIMDYKTLIQSPEKIIKFVADYLGLVIQNNQYVDTLHDTELNIESQTTSNYLVSSKSRAKLYNAVYKKASSMDMSECWKSYNRVAEFIQV